MEKDFLYTSGGIISNLLNEDCVTGMKKYDDSFFDLAIVDPPYGIGLVKTPNGSWGIRSKDQQENCAITFDWDFEKPKKEYFDQLFRVSKNQIIFGANHFIENMPFNSSCWLVWDKCNGDNYFADCELAWTSFKTATRKIKCRWGGANSHREGKRIHSTQKPISLYRFIIDKYSQKYANILDTHLGSGSSRIAAFELNRNFLGFEIDSEMCIKSHERFFLEKKKIKLF